MTRTELVRMRREAGLSRAKLAAMIGVTPGSIYRWERGLRGISPLVGQLLNITLKREIGRKAKLAQEMK